MRNLRNIRCSAGRAPSDITALCWDAGKDEVVATFGPTEDNPKIELIRIAAQKTSPCHLEFATVASWDAASPHPDLLVDRVVDIHHFTDSLTTCLILTGGDIVIVQETESGTTPGTAHVEIVGSIDAGISAARWSPEDELLAITTTTNTVVLMSRTFDGIAEAHMIGDDLKASKHVSVGWGRKETQFQGKGAKAKALRDPTIPEKVDTGAPSSKDDGQTTISWRGDGAYVAINSVQPDSRRVIRIYSRDGILDGVTEPVDGLEGALSWRPSGNLLAGIQRFEDRLDVVFFEKNGLRHGKFALRISSDKADAADKIVLEWNSESTVLAVLLKDRIQLWTTSNYHWYLKQEIFTESQRLRIPHLAWHPEKSLRLAIGILNKTMLSEYAFHTARGSTAPPNDHGAVAVVDGQTIRLTSFRSANIPPPMAMFELKTESSVIDVAFAADHSALAILHHGGVDFYAWKTEGSRANAPKLLRKTSLAERNHAQLDQSFLQIALAGHHEAHILELNDGLHVLSCDFDTSSTQTETWKMSKAESLSSISSFSTENGTQAVIQDVDGGLSLLADGGREPLPVKFPVNVPWVEVVSHAQQVLVFGLSRKGHLYVNSRLLTKNCTSFIVTNSHLIFTTNNHFIKFSHLENSEKMEIPPDDPDGDERCRSIERGARLVTAMPTNMTVVLQMPRGNLETIAPRAMVVAGIRELIDAKNYGKAFTTCRTQRVDMNILCDYKQDQFLTNVGLFIDQVREVTYLDLFLSSLREEDVTQTMYKDTKPGLKLQTSPSTSSHKVNTICDAVLKVLQSRKNTNLQNIITAYVCKIPPALDDGLLVVAELMQEDESLAEKAVEHICFLVDAYKLYDHALGLYNLDLALLVAQQSQRDPREYLPFIQNLHQMELVRRKFSIDDHLSRQDKALGHLQTLGAFDEVCTYTSRYKLYQTALKLYRYDELRLRTLTDLYASFLESISKFRDAGLAYESIGNFAKATSCYRAASPSSWRECLFAARQQQDPPMSAISLSELAEDLADALTEAKDHASAATIQLDYLSSPPAAIRSLCKGALFADALRLASLHSTPDVPLEPFVDAGLVDALSSSTDFLADCKAQLRAQVPRILELRRRAAEDPLAFYEGELPAGDLPDDVSVAASSRLSTSASLFTRYTAGGASGTAMTGASRATSKNRKREEKKRARGRKGTVYEEEYLVNSVRRLVERVDGSAREEVERLAFALVRRGMSERARAVEALAAEVVAGCEAAIKEVWPAKVVENEVGEGAEYGYRPSGADAVLHESIAAQKVQQEPPVIKSFARLSLLG